MLVTGFQSYGGRSLNPAEELVKALDGTVIAGERVRGIGMPVDYRRLGPGIAAAIEETRPRAVIGFGLWPAEPVIRLERVAVNIADFEISDNQGLVAREPVAEGGAPAYLSTLPLHAIHDRLLAAGVPCRLSGTAGTFLCNALMYHTLRACAESRPAPLCGFIHLPYLPQQVARLIRDTAEEARLELHQRADLASMSLQTMLEGARLAIETALEHAPRR
jgi:pyroglutamyl-peptidase